MPLKKKNKTLHLKPSQTEWNVIGLMSGTSLDGVDIAYCNFRSVDGKWSYTLKYFQTISYPVSWTNKLKSSTALSGEKLLLLHNEYGLYLGSIVNKFIKKYNINSSDIIASHGHTIFHQPEKNFTFQLGSGAAIAAITNGMVISDFRSLDMALKGQGAPLVPAGDKWLFPQYKLCLNLGGIANISFDRNDNRIAFDICPVNMILNPLAMRKGLKYDAGGRLASKGYVNEALLKKLNSLSYFRKPAPKSLGKEWVNTYYAPLLDEFSNLSVENQLSTVSEQIACQIERVVRRYNLKGKGLLTGGGVFNKYLVNRIKKKTLQIDWVQPADEVVKFKEALIFAFLAVLRLNEKNNCLKSVTGSKRNNSGGAVYYGNS